MNLSTDVLITKVETNTDEIKFNLIKFTQYICPKKSYVRRESVKYEVNLDGLQKFDDAIY